MFPSKSLLLYTIILFLSLIQIVESALNTNDCKKVILKKNELYCDFRNINSFFIGQNSDNLTNTDTFQKHEDLIIFSDGPQIFSKDDIVINTRFREYIDKNEICSLIYNTPINTYFMYTQLFYYGQIINLYLQFQLCIQNQIKYTTYIQTQSPFIIDNKFQILINTQFKLQIQDVDNFNCSQIDHYADGFIIFCYSLHQIKLYQLSKEQDKLQQTIIFESEYMNLQCLIKFHQFSNSFLIIYYQCLKWKIQIYENNSFKLEINQHVLKEKYNIEGNFLEILPCYCQISGLNYNLVLQFCFHQGDINSKMKNSRIYLLQKTQNQMRLKQHLISNVLQNLQQKLQKIIILYIHSPKSIQIYSLIQITQFFILYKGFSQGNLLNLISLKFISHV